MDASCPGLLTCASHETQLKAFYTLQKDPINRESFTALRHSLFAICLDLDSTPSTYSEAAFLAHIGNCGNRWYHSSLQVVIFGNSKGCAICNFSAYLDGNTMMRGAAEITRRAFDCSLEIRKEKQGTPTSISSIKLQFNISSKWPNKARKDLKFIQDNQQATFHIEGISKSRLRQYALQPVPVFILGLQLMANKLTGAEVRIEQFVSMSRYACMDLVTADVSTPEVLRFVKVCQKPSHDQLFDFLVKAVDSQKDSVRKARSRLPLETIISLYSCQLKGSRKLYSSLNTLALIWVLRALGLFKPRMREVIVSHPDIYSEVPLVGRPGVRLPYVKYFGLHYQILEDSAVITIMPSVNWTIPNPEVVSELRSSLDQIYDIVAACKG